MPVRKPRAARSVRQRVGRAGIAAAAVVLGGLAVTHSFAQALVKIDPQTAQVLAPYDARSSRNTPRLNLIWTVRRIGFGRGTSGASRDDTRPDGSDRDGRSGDAGAVSWRGGPREPAVRLFAGFVAARIANPPMGLGAGGGPRRYRGRSSPLRHGASHVRQRPRPAIPGAVVGDCRTQGAVGIDRSDERRRGLERGFPRICRRTRRRSPRATSRLFDESARSGHRRHG